MIFTASYSSVYFLDREAYLSCEGRRGQNWEIFKQRVVYKRSCDAVILYRYVYWKQESKIQIM
jgi:tRNA1(Val) A37 N6-methylase TrmN6